MARKETAQEERARIGAHRRLSSEDAKFRYRRRWHRRHSQYDESAKGRRGAFRARMLERFGLDVVGNATTVLEERARLRNARKRERRAARA